MFFDIAMEKQIGERRVSLELQSDAGLTALVGVSGAGKTTILNCIAGLIRPDTGHITIGGECLFDAHARINLPPEKRHAGYVFQDARLFPHMNVAANLSYGMEGKAEGSAIVNKSDVIDLLGIGHLQDRLPVNLSGGETRRIAIGRALLSSPKFLLLDEPMSSLDRARADGISQLIERIRDDLKLPILLVSHDPAEVERLAGRTVSLDQPASTVA